MAANTLEKFEIQTVNRQDIRGAEYNPRKISKEAEARLRKDLREIGLIQPIIINIQTMNIVGGHQRIAAMDSIIRRQDYDMTVAMVDMSAEEEVKANVLLNNPNVMGEWDLEKLAGIHAEFPDIDFSDLGFDTLDTELIFAGTDFEEEMVTAVIPPTARREVEELDQMRNTDKIKEAKAAQKRKDAEENSHGDQGGVEAKNNMLMIVFQTNSAKEEFMSKCGKDPNTPVLKDTFLHELSQGKYNLW